MRHDALVPSARNFHVASIVGDRIYAPGKLGDGEGEGWRGKGLCEESSIARLDSTLLNSLISILYP